MPKPFLMLGQGYIGPIPIPVIIFVLFILFGWIVKTGNQRQGRQAQPKSVARVHILPIENNYMLTDNDKRTGWPLPEDAHAENTAGEKRHLHRKSRPWQIYNDTAHMHVYTHHIRKRSALLFS